MMNKKIALITGITGMVGSHLADYILKNTDWKIFGMCRWRSPFDNISHLIPRIEKKDRIDLIYGDLNDYISLQNVLQISKPDYVFHLAAQSFPKTSFSSPIDTFNTNIIGTAKLLEAIKKDLDLSQGLQDVINSMKIVLAADKSVRTGKQISSIFLFIIFFI